jgi:ribonuclease-3
MPAKKPTDAAKPAPKKRTPPASRSSRRGPKASAAAKDRFLLAEEITGHTFSDIELLRRALTHPSVEQTGPLATYERLEFLGDAVIAFVVSDLAYNLFPDLREGELTRIRIGAVAGTTLSEVARGLGLDKAVDIGNREMRETGRGIDSALENVFEALVAALYLDAGLDVAREFVGQALGPFIRADMTVPEHPKSALMELTTAAGKRVFFDIVSAEGPPHEVVFTAHAVIDGEVLGTGVGKSKKAAETIAAEQALEALRKPASKKRRRRS